MSRLWRRTFPSAKKETAVVAAGLPGFPPSKGGAVRAADDQAGDLPPPERNQNADADAGAFLLPGRNAVRERMVDRKRHGHFDEHRTGG